MPKKTYFYGSRRDFIKSTSVATGGVMLGAPFIAKAQGANDQIRVAVIGAGGKGASDTDETAKAGGKIVALCDVDQKTLDARKQKYPEAETFQDFRKMYEKMGKEIDAVVVATPDHTHYPASVIGMREGKHCFCQKPLTHSVWEARQMRELAKEKKIATQMGNQGSAASGLRRSVEVSGRHHRAGEAPARLEQSSHLAARHGSSQGRGSSAGACRLGRMDRAGADAPLQGQGVSHLRLARLAGLRHRRARRHGLPYREHAVPRVEARLPDHDRGGVHRHEQGSMAEELKDSLPVPRARRTPAARLLVVRRRLETGQRHQ
jgi:hypothetical protein